MCGAKYDGFKNVRSYFLRTFMKTSQLSPHIYKAFILCSAHLWSNSEFGPQVLERCRLCSADEKRHSFREEERKTQNLKMSCFQDPGHVAEGDEQETEGAAERLAQIECGVLTTGQ